MLAALGEATFFVFAYKSELIGADLPSATMQIVIREAANMEVVRSVSQPLSSSRLDLRNMRSTFGIEDVF